MNRPLANQFEPPREEGFTLFELMVTVAVAAILLVVGVPAFTSFVQNNRAAAHANELVTAFAFARNEAIRRGALFVATNRDPVYPGPDGQLMAGAGAMVAAIAAAAMREPDLVVGKPEPRLFEAAAEVAGMELGDAVVIGDGITTDIRAANAVGARSVLMLTGVTTRDDLARFPEIKPTRVCANSRELEAALAEMSLR